jgi:hypothetical protein
VHDYSALVDSILIQRKDVGSISRNPSADGALDVTAGAAGARLRIATTTPMSVIPRPPRRPGSEGPAAMPLDVAAVLVAPVRITVVMATAAERRLPVEV